MRGLQAAAEAGKEGAAAAQQQLAEAEARHASRRQDMDMATAQLQVGRCCAAGMERKGGGAGGACVRFTPQHGFEARSSIAPEPISPPPRQTGLQAARLHVRQALADLDEQRGAGAALAAQVAAQASELVVAKVRRGHRGALRHSRCGCSSRMPQRACTGLAWPRP